MSAFPAAEQGSVVLAAGESSTRTVYLIIAGLAAIGIALTVLALWLIRATRPENELLAPLERMSDREWRTKNPAGQRRDLDALRPSGAVPKNPEPMVPSIDEEFARAKPELGSFDDLSDESPKPAPVPASAVAGPGEVDHLAHAATNDAESADATPSDATAVEATPDAATPDDATAVGATHDAAASGDTESADADLDEPDESGGPIDQSVATLDHEDVER